MVTPICFGTSALGDMPETYGYGVDEERARATIEAIFNGPVNFSILPAFTAWAAAGRIGAVIRENGGLPEGFVVSTKLDRDPETNVFDAARARRSLELSLKALGLERIDLLNLHDPEHAQSLAEATGRDGALGELFRFREEGLVKAVGLAAGDVDIMMPLLRDWGFDALITHNRFTIANRNAEAMMDLACERGIAVLECGALRWRDIGQGLARISRYVYQEAGDAVLDPIRRIEAICARHGVPPAPPLYSSQCAKSKIVSTVCGVSRAGRVQQTLDWATYPISDAVWDDLKSVPFSTDDPEAAREYKAG